MRGPRLLIVAPALVGAILTGCGDDATSNPVIPDAGTPDTGNVVPDAGKPETAPELKPAGVPTFSTPGGKYTAAQSVTISSSTPNADIWYTLDGSTPIPSASQKYSAPISVTASLTIKAIASATGFKDSLVNTANYTDRKSVV